MSDGAADWMRENNVDPDAYEVFLDGVNFGLEQVATGGDCEPEVVRAAYLEYREENDA